MEIKGEFDKRLEKYYGTEAYKEISKTFWEFWIERTLLEQNMAYLGLKSAFALLTMRSSRGRKKIADQDDDFNPMEQVEDLLRKRKELNLKWFGTAKRKEINEKLKMLIEIAQK